jgi:magnesium-transporting ATPase (P-type)
MASPTSGAAAAASSSGLSDAAAGAGAGAGAAAKLSDIGIELGGAAAGGAGAGGAAAAPAAAAAAGDDKAALSQLERNLAAQVDLARAADRSSGLSHAAAEELRRQWGPNQLPEKVRNPLLIFLSYFWGPMPCMIWIAIIIELAKAIITGEGW